MTIKALEVDLGVYPNTYWGETKYLESNKSGSHRNLV